MNSLPDDNFGVYVENEIDRVRLLWLVNQIGEEKLRRSVGKYKAKYRDAQPFVSRLLTWYRVKVPVELYAPVRVPVYWVYVLCLRAQPKIKIGMTGSWPKRAFDFVKLHAAIEDVFDVDLSVAVLVGGDKQEALRIEREAKHLFAKWRVESPWRDNLIPYGADGHKEWFAADTYFKFMDYVASLEIKNKTVQPLRNAIALLNWEEAYLRLDSNIS